MTAAITTSPLQHGTPHRATTATAAAATRSHRTTRADHGSIVAQTPHSAVNGEKDSRMIHIFAKFFFVKKLKKKDCTCAHSGGPEHISAKTRVVGAPHSTPHNNTLALY
jgi:hypothetical protein